MHFQNAVDVLHCDTGACGDALAAGGVEEGWLGALFLGH